MALVATNLIGAVGASWCFVMSRAATCRGDDTFVALSDDVTRASQAQAAAERMVAVGRAYLLSAEPELLHRAEAADAKLTRTLALLDRGSSDQQERRGLEDLRFAARDYRRLSATLASDPSLRGDSHVVATALRSRLIPARERLLTALDQLVARRQASLNGLRAAARESGRRWMIGFVVVGIGETGLSLVLVWFLWSALRIQRERIDDAARRSRRETDGRLSRPTGARSSARAMFRPFA